MKSQTLLTVLLISIALFSCKQSQNSEVVLIRGEFIFTNGAAVIKGEEFIYGVEINNLTHELSKKTMPLQREEYDMVPVVINGIVKPNPEEGWEEIVEIKEIIGVSEPTSELITKVSATSPQEENTEQEIISDN